MFVLKLFWESNLNRNIKVYMFVLNLRGGYIIRIGRNNKCPCGSGLKY
ncbi:SEC-C metal-binding domain-containing protein [Solibacillus sp. FSL R7-0668]